MYRQHINKQLRYNTKTCRFSFQRTQTNFKPFLQQATTICRQYETYRNCENSQQFTNYTMNKIQNECKHYDIKYDNLTNLFYTRKSDNCSETIHSAQCLSIYYRTPNCDMIISFSKMIPYCAVTYQHGTIYHLTECTLNYLIAQTNTVNHSSKFQKPHFDKQVFQHFNAIF